MTDYSKLSDKEFDRILNEIIDDDNRKPHNLMAIAGIYEILSEYYNNDVLTRWENENPQDEDEDEDE